MQCNANCHRIYLDKSILSMGYTNRTEDMVIFSDMHLAKNLNLCGESQDRLGLFGGTAKNAALEIVCPIKTVV